MKRILKIDYSRKWFNPIFFELQKHLKDEKVSLIIVYGGKGASKSFSVAQIFAMEAIKGFSSVAMRKEQSRIKNTLKKTLKEAVKTVRLKDGFEALQFSWRSLVSDSEIVMIGLEDAEKAKGLEGFTYILMDELNQFTKDDLDQVQLSLRGLPNQKVFATFNPIDEKHWVKTQLIDQYEWDNLDHCLPSPNSTVKRNKQGTAILIKTTFEDNYWVVGSPCGTYGFVDKTLQNKYDELKSLNPKSYMVNVLGEWGRVDNDNPFFRNYSFDTHVGKENIEPLYGVETVFSFDFNIDPCTCVIGQKLKGEEGRKGIYIYETISAKGGTNELCDEIIRKGWMQKVSKQILRITGDSSGNKGDTRGHSNDYDIIREKLGLSDKHTSKTPRSNKSLIDSRELVNYCLYNIPYHINPGGNDVLINDLQVSEMDKNGKPKKNRDGFEQDAADAFRYMHHHWFKGSIDIVGHTKSARVYINLISH